MNKNDSIRICADYMDPKCIYLTIWINGLKISGVDESDGAGRELYLLMVSRASLECDESCWLRTGNLEDMPS